MHPAGHGGRVMARNRNPSASATVTEIFNRFPLGCPITAIVVGIDFTALVIFFFDNSRSGYFPVLALAAGPVLFGIGLIMLPFGIVTATEHAAIHRPHLPKVWCHLPAVQKAIHG